MPENARYAATPIDRAGCADAYRFRPAKRVVMVALGLALAVTLGVARWLSPDSAGYGTHRQLGLPPCSFVMMFSMECPSCGMTTSWSHMMRGNGLAAAQSNAGGAMLAALAMFAAPWLIVSASLGRWWPVGVSEKVLIILAVSLATIIIVDWFRRTGGPF